MGIPPWPVFIVASGGDCHGAAIGLAIQFSGICLQLFFFRMVIEHE